VINLQFIGDFGVYCLVDACYHWVEVKYKTDLSLEGPRSVDLNTHNEPYCRSAHRQRDVVYVYDPVSA